MAAKFWCEVGCMSDAAATMADNETECSDQQA
jgi:hypothetical protein